ncbi:MAG: hypothetical protein AB1571_01940 [Nanoarchaeota archaeon]
MYTPITRGYDERDSYKPLGLVGDGKVDLKGPDTKNKKKQTIKIDEKDFEKMKEAAESCPINIIHIMDKNWQKDN